MARQDKAIATTKEETAALHQFVIKSLAEVEKPGERKDLVANLMFLEEELGLALGEENGKWVKRLLRLDDGEHATTALRRLVKEFQEAFNDHRDWVVDHLRQYDAEFEKRREYSENLVRRLIFLEKQLGLERVRERGEWRGRLGRLEEIEEAAEDGGQWDSGAALSFRSLIHRIETLEDKETTWFKSTSDAIWAINKRLAALEARGLGEDEEGRVSAWWRDVWTGLSPGDLVHRIEMLEAKRPGNAADWKGWAVEAEKTMQDLSTRLWALEAKQPSNSKEREAEVRVLRNRLSFLEGWAKGHESKEPGAECEITGPGEEDDKPTRVTAVRWERDTKDPPLVHLDGWGRTEDHK